MSVKTVDGKPLEDGRAYWCRQSEYDSWDIGQYCDFYKGFIWFGSYEAQPIDELYGLTIVGPIEAPTI